MELEAVFGMIFTLLLIAMIGGFILLIPLSRRLGLLLEAWLQEKKATEGVEELLQLRSAVRALEEEVGGLQERLRFTEELLEKRSREALPGGGEG